MRAGRGEGENWLGPWLLAHGGLDAVLLTGALLLGVLLCFAATSRR
ncbi:MAG: hypothetical protein HDQ92_04580 [Desulfovibrio sp.]|nr:hypothetical protein [Desulfovibrio sp.]